MIAIGNSNKYILDHELVPKHEILSKDSVKELLAKYNISLSQLPKIKVSDPVVSIIGAKPGEVIKIIRNSFTAGYSVYYRLVVEDDYISDDELIIKSSLDSLDNEDIEDNKEGN